MRNFLFVAVTVFLSAILYFSCSNSAKEEQKTDTIVAIEEESGDPVIDSLLNCYAKNGKTLDSIYNDEKAMKNSKLFSDCANKANLDQLQLEGYEIEMTEKQEQRFHKIRDRISKPMQLFEEKYAHLYTVDNLNEKTEGNE